MAGFCTGVTQLVCKCASYLPVLSSFLGQFMLSEAQQSLCVQSCCTMKRAPHDSSFSPGLNASHCALRLTELCCRRVLRLGALPFQPAT